MPFTPITPNGAARGRLRGPSRLRKFAQFAPSPTCHGPPSRGDALPPQAEYSWPRAGGNAAHKIHKSVVMERGGGVKRASCPKFIFPNYPISIILLCPLAVPRAGECEANRISSRSFCSIRWRGTVRPDSMMPWDHFIMMINNKPRKTSVTRSIFASRFYTNKGETK